MRLLYDILTVMVALVLLPYGILKGLPYGLAVRGTLERFAHYPRSVKKLLREKRVILIHAVSVGEVLAAVPLIRKLKSEHPQHFLVLSTTTFTGRHVAAQIEEIGLLVFFPLDLGLIMRRFMRRLHPELVLIVETELWPNFLRLIRRRNIPLLLVNGRISKRSFSRYRRVRFLVRPMLKAFTAFCMQDNICARRIKALGAAEKRVLVTGNVKFDVASNLSEHAAAPELQKILAPGGYVWVGGSTRTGENEILLDCHRQLLERGIPSFLVLAPRHPRRFDAVADLLNKSNVAFVRRSEWLLSPPPLGYSVLLLDTMGELDQVYELAEVVFVGGSLVPLGGHNLLEPARSGKPVLHGPHMANFMEIAKLLKEAGASQRVDNPEDLLLQLELLYADPALRTKMGSNGRMMIEKNAGATLKTLEQIRPLLRSPDEQAGKSA
ncbi:3-deoxy-D-manno-octulosonic acid transferase [Geopsychrobacter electrodiphilus]|uniref:3-deoxy-D-manno-octulosonic acid transferase n=1 Tax=Geopsychrobacter electrodiphilus TaxID=225196 RepID=UPI000361302D|nr:3-deoxy-D-manno-octulosonic acid transferase [Geopsychrobacter electrodiphilus]